MSKLFEQVEGAYIAAVNSNTAANPARVIPLVDAFMARWNVARAVPPAVTQDLMQDLMPVLGGPTNVTDAAAKLRANLVAGAKQYNVAGAGRAVMYSLRRVDERKRLESSTESSSPPPAAPPRRLG